MTALDAEPSIDDVDAESPQLHLDVEAPLADYGDRTAAAMACSAIAAAVRSP